MKEECNVEMAGLQYEQYGELQRENFVSVSPVLEAWSRWNEERFTNGKDVIKMVELYTGTDVLTTRFLCDYMSGGILKVPDTLPAFIELLRVSDMLLISKIKQLCIDCITLAMTVNEANCFDILESSSVYNFEHPGMNKYIRGHLLSLTKSKRMLNLSYDSLQYLLNDEELSYWPEDDRFVLIKNWCNASNDRLNKFEHLFISLDLSKIDRDILRSVLRNDELVRESRTVTQKINEFLQLKEKENIPVVYLIGYEQIVGFNMEDNNIFRLNFPSFFRRLIRNLPTNDDSELYFPYVSDETTTIQLITDNGKGNILLYQDGKLHEYDLTTNECKERNILLDGKKFSAVTHVLSDENLVFFGICYVMQRQRRPRRTRYDFATRNISNRTATIPFTEDVINGCTLYCVKTYTEQDLELKPVRSFAFGISSACISGSKVFLTTTAYKYDGKIMCYDLDTSSFSVIYQLRKSYRTFFSASKWMQFPTIKRMFPMRDQLVLVTDESILSISRTDFSVNFFQEGVCTTFEKHIYGHLSETIIEVCCENIRVIEIQDQKKLTTKSTTYTPEISTTTLIIGGRLPRTKPLCHIMCPHCYLHAWEKEEEEKLPFWQSD